MINSSHGKFLKYGAILGLLPYVTPTGQQKYNLKQTFKQHQHNNSHHKEHLHYSHLYRSYNRNRILRWQKIYTLALIAANLMATLYGVIFAQIEDNFFVSNLVSIIVFVAQIITVNSILLETIFTYEKYYELIDNYDRVEMLIKQLLQIQLCMGQIKKRQRRKYAFMILTLYGSLMASITIIFIKTYNGYFWYALIAIIILRTRCLQLSFYLDYIIYYMELFNVKLKALISCKIDGNYLVLDIDYQYIESFEYLRNLNRIYMDIYALHDKYNDIFGHSFAALYTVVVLDIIINLYWTFLTMFEYYESYYNYITFSTMLPLIVSLIMLCYTADQCEKQCTLILICLRRLLKTSYTSKNAECYNSLLQRFILQILQNPITITANGYFTINLKTLMRILAIIVTYLVILLQFRKTNVNEETPKITENNSNVNEMEWGNISLYGKNVF